MIEREVERGRLEGARDECLGRGAQPSPPAAAGIRVVAAEAGHGCQHRLPIAAKDPKQHGILARPRAHRCRSIELVLGRRERGGDAILGGPPGRSGTPPPPEPPTPLPARPRPPPPPP